MQISVYVEKVFIAQKKEKDIGRPWWKGKEVGRRIYGVGRLTRERNWGRAGWKVAKRDGKDGGRRQ